MKRPGRSKVARSLRAVTLAVAGAVLSVAPAASLAGGDSTVQSPSNPGNGGNGGVRPRVNGLLPGRFNAIVAGYYSGQGRADVERTVVRIHVAVMTEDGNRGTLQAPGLVISGRHFAGTGHLMGRPVQIFGRLDSARSSRLTALVTTIDGQCFRIVGMNPADPGNPNWATHPGAGHGQGQGNQNASGGQND